MHRLRSWEPLGASARTVCYLPGERARAMSAAAQPFALTELLTRAGARIRGRRADCPRCKRQRSVSFDESRGVYHCHGAGCDFSGGVLKLARELGLAPRLSGTEYRAFVQNQERADRAARELYGHVKARRFELMEQLRWLGRLEVRAHEAGLNHPATWDALGMIYRDRPALLAELAIIENCGAAYLNRFLSERQEAREREIDGVLVRGGIWDSQGKFVEVLP